MDFTESKAGAAREIALAFGVPPLLLGLLGDNTFSNYAEANRAFWRQTVLPLVARVQKSFQAWLQPGFGSFRLDYNADRLEALASERAAEWERVGKAAFLTLDEQREALGYGPAPKEALVAKRDLALERRYSPDQPRVPAGNSDGGRWTSGGGGGDSGVGFGEARDVGGRVQTAQNTDPKVASDADGGWKPLGDHRPQNGGFRSFEVAGGFTPEQLDMSVQDFVSNFCKGSINSELPSQFLSATVKEVLEQAKSGSIAANKCKKLLGQDRFRKP